MLYHGLYEQVINKQLNSELSEIPEARKAVTPIDKAEASKVLAQYLADVVQKGLDNVADNGGDISAQIALTNQIVDLIQNTTREADFAALGVDQRAEQLLALLRETDPRLAVGKTAADLNRPETSIAQSSLFTGAIHEPQMYTELKKEIVSADRIDMLVSFIKWSGLRLLMDELREFTQNGGELRIITTSYMGATDVKAIEELRQLPNTKIKVSYDTKRTRLHAKTYVFYRNTDFTTAYVGSSNLSNAAISSGLEWNVKVTKKDLPETIDKIAATFESYWNSSEFEYYSEDQKERLARALRAEKYVDGTNPEVYTMDIMPYSYQQEILDKLEAERKVRGYNRNLVVAATGTGKTVISALDYKRFRKQNPGRPCRLLFVAHREEILKQSLYTFRAVLKEANFGEMFVGSHKPDSIDNLFISIQTFNSQDFTAKTTPDYYDYIIVDEFHHAAAPTYQKLLAYYQPQILLGLTATPERMDGKSILPYFNNRIAAEIRLPEAIDRKLLCPFQYFGVTDTVDLDTLKWSSGGYDKGELTRVYTLSGAMANRRADLVIGSLLKYVTDINDVKGLGFCVSIEHAEFMCQYFNEHNIPSMFLTGHSPDEERKAAKQRLVDGEVRFIFVVDTCHIQRIDLVDQILLKGFKGFCPGKVLLLLPIAQLREHIRKIRPDLLTGKLLVCHMSNADLDEIVHIVVHIFSVCIAPLAVFLVEYAVLLPADALVLQGHTAALANKLPGRAQKRVDGHIKELGKELKCLGIRHGLAVFPTAHRLPGDKHLFRQLLLGKALFRPKLQNDIFGFHIPYLRICDTAIVTLDASPYKQLSVAVAFVERTKAAEGFHFLSGVTYTYFYFTISRAT